MKTITVDGVEYAPATTKTPSKKGMEYVIVRTYTAGVFAGYLKKREGKEVILENARRIHYWEGAASLSQLAQSGTSKPDKCRFPEEVDEILLTEATEILAVTKQAKESIDSVKIWKA